MSEEAEKALLKQRLSGYRAASQLIENEIQNELAKESAFVSFSKFLDLFEYGAYSKNEISLAEEIDHFKRLGELFKRLLAAQHASSRF